MTRVVAKLRELFGAPTANRTAHGGGPSVFRMSEIVLSHAMERSVAFSHDGRFAAVTMALNAFPGSQVPATSGVVSVHRFDAANGVIDAQPVAEFKAPAGDLASMDICKFLLTAPGERYRILVVDQGADAIPLFEFDVEDRTIAPAGVFAGGLSFPHGIDVSADASFVAMTNYGDDSVCIARLTSSIVSAGERATA
jgi:hypothetical protein